MSIRKSIILIILFASIVAAACSLPEQVTPPPEGALETAVAATLTALAVEPAPPGSTAEPPQEQPPPPLVDDAPAVLRIVYTDNGNPWVIEGDQPPRKLSETGGVETVLISSDGMKVVFIRRGSPGENPTEVRSINMDGSGEQVLMSPADFDSLYPLGEFVHNDYASIEFIPGTHTLLMNTRGIPLGPGLAKYDDLLRLDADTGERTTLFEPGAGGDFVLSPDGSRLALLKPTSISLVQSDGTGLIPEVLTYDSIITYSEFQYYVQPIWSADGSELMVAIPGADILAPGESGEVWRIRAGDGSSELMGLIEGDLYFPQFSEGAAIISPDFSALSYAQKPAPNTSNLAFAAVDGSGETIAAAGNFSWYGWSPDGSHYLIGQGSPFELALGAGNQPPIVLGQGTDAKWISNSEFLFLSGSLNDWTLNKGTLDAAVVPLISPAGDFIEYDFDS